MLLLVVKGGTALRYGRKTTMSDTDMRRVTQFSQIPAETLLNTFIDTAISNGWGFHDVAIADMRAEILARMAQR